MEQSFHPNDVDYDDLTGDVIIRILSAPLIDDPLSSKNEQLKWLQVDFRPEEIFSICQLAEESFKQQDTLLEIDRSCLPLHVVTDLHGQIGQVLRILHTMGSPQKETYLFLGDYVDRGVQGVETMLLLFCLKIRYPFQVYLVRGNHEDVNPTLCYGFYDECLNRFDKIRRDLGEKIWRAFLGAFNHMPLAALIVGRKGVIFCAHGGISPYMDSIQDIKSIKRPLIIPPYGLACDLVWSDPTEVPNGWSMSHRYISYLYGTDVLENFCKKNKVDFVIRGHQINREMFRYGFRMNPSGRLVTLFSAPSYSGFKNNGAIITIDENIFCVKAWGGSDISPKYRNSPRLFRKRASKQESKPKTPNRSLQEMSKYSSETVAMGSEIPESPSKLAARKATDTKAVDSKYHEVKSKEMELSSCPFSDKTKEERSYELTREEKSQDADQKLKQKKSKTVLLKKRP